VATFTGDATFTALDYTATIDWGDSTTSAGSISGSLGGPFTVSGSHIYSGTGPFNIAVTVTDKFG